MAAAQRRDPALPRDAGGAEVLLVHPGGPFWAKKDAGAWSIPKGELADGEDPRAGAIREFAEELGSPPPEAELVDLGECRQRGGKVVTAFAAEGDLDPARVRSNTFELEWPPRSGRRREFPEIDRADWFPLEQAREKLLAAQTVFIDRLVDHLATRQAGAAALPDREAHRWCDDPSDVDRRDLTASGGDSVRTPRRLPGRRRSSRQSMRCTSSSGVRGARKLRREDR